MSREAEGQTTSANGSRSDSGRVEARRPRWVEAVEWVSIIAFVFAWGAVCSGFFSSLSLARAAWLLPLGLMIGFAVADFIGGTVHWFADTYFDPRTPVVGPLLIEPFRDHHRDPLGITRHGFLELSGNSALASLPLAGAMLWLGEPGAHAGMQLLHTGVIALAMALFATNAFHRWAHLPHPPAAVAWFQRRRLMLAPDRHDVHHRAAHDRSYCVTSGWLNPLLDRFHFFGHLEALLLAVRLEPKRDATPSPQTGGGASSGATATAAEARGSASR